MTSGVLAAGLAVLALAWAAPHTGALPGPFTAHMTMHMGVVAVAAPLLALGLAGTARDPVRFGRGWLAPVPASFVEMALVWGWHAPALHHFARHTTTGLVLEQASFLGSGLWLWAAALGGDPARSQRRRAAGVVALLLTSMHMTLLGALLALAPRELYGHAHGGHAGLGGHGGLGGLGGLEDQQLGGAIMLAVGGVSYLAGGVLLSAGLLRGARA